MENMSNALLMAAAILIAVLVLSLAVVLFRSAYGVSKSYDSAMDSAEARSFNVEFTKFIGAPLSKEGTETTQYYATIHDVISVANFIIDENSKRNENEQMQVDLQLNTPFPAGIDTSGEIIGLQDNTSLFNQLISECYYKDNAMPIAGTERKFEIQIIKVGVDGKIIHVKFTQLD